MGKSFVEKILSKKSGREVRSGDIVEVEPDLCMSHDNAGLVIKKFLEIGQDNIWDVSKILIILDHRVPAESIKTANEHKLIRDFVAKKGIKNFLDIGEGICHQVVIEKLSILPGQVAIGTDSHTTSYGCIGAFSTGIGATEMAAVWATGKIWLRVPESYKIVIKGNLPEGIYAKDVILHIIGNIGSDGAIYKSIEFYGNTVQEMSISERFVLCNLSMEMGAKSAIVPFDRKTEEYIRDIGVFVFEPIFADENAKYERVFEYNISKLKPQVAFPHSVDNVKSVSEAKGIKVNQVFIGSCTNGRLDDLEVAAKILNGKHIAKNVRLIIGPASKNIYSSAMKEGLFDIFISAGAVIINPGCGPCLGAHQGIIADGEVAVATTNRNFKGRMGSPEGKVFLASPATAAATAITGTITDPRDFL
ncbi:MAG: 3-isopropylmalate dehydratase large subunit [Candidatus Cloacimonas sp. 4484_209]|nr:MAG: 3-isopropylmalate dehydratase large subunit [Candidatus Cloacimonas sp. 4484_209]